MRLLKISAFLCPYGVRNSWNECFAPGIFDDFCREARAVPMFRMHEPEIYLGAWYDLESRADGVYAKGTIMHPLALRDILANRITSGEISVAWLQTRGRDQTEPCHRRPREIWEPPSDIPAEIAEKLRGMLSRQKPFKRLLTVRKPAEFGEASLVDKGSFPGTWWKVDDLYDDSKE